MIQLETSRIRLGLFAAVLALALAPSEGFAQGRGGGAPATPKTQDPLDLGGYWVSVVTQNWRLRMVLPPKGEYMGIPMTKASQEAADAWDLAKDEAAGNQCKGYGAPIVMTNPERLHITWPDDNTLQMEIDYGTQTRTLHFGNWKPEAGSKPSLQGESTARWVSRERGGRNPQTNYLVVTTRNLQPGYLRKNGVPYSEGATVTESYDFFQESDGLPWMIITTEVHDPKYLERDFIISSQFRKERDGSKWDPSPCSFR
jgi:hypothetical protein